MKIKEFIELKKFIKTIDNSIKVKLGKAFECDTEKRIVWIPLKDNKKDSEMFKTWYEEYFNETLTDKGLAYISALHEVGHILTWTQELEDERTEKYGIMKIAHQFELMSTEELNKQYFEIPMELIATRWGRNFYENIM